MILIRLFITICQSPFRRLFYYRSKTNQYSTYFPERRHFMPICFHNTLLFFTLHS